MSIEVPLRKEIEDYQIKFIGQATPRMIIWGIVAVASVLSAVIITMKLEIPTAISGWVFMFVGIPAMTIGFWRPKSRQTPEAFAKDLITHYLMTNAWSYRSESPFLIDAEKEVVNGVKKKAKRTRKQNECSRVSRRSPCNE